MANVVIAILTLVLTFILASYGVYTNVEASRRTQFGMLISSTIDREVVYVQDLRNDLGRMPDVTDVDSARFAAASTPSATFSYAVVGGVGYVCAQAVANDIMTGDAMTKVSHDHPGSFLSGECGNSGTAGSSVVSMRVG